MIPAGEDGDLGPAMNEGEDGRLFREKKTLPVFPTAPRPRLSIDLCPAAAPSPPFGTLSSVDASRRRQRWMSTKKATSRAPAMSAPNTTARMKERLLVDDVPLDELTEMMPK